VVGSVQTQIGVVPKVSSPLCWKDHWGTFKVRWAVGRMSYTVEPGLYCTGNPDEKSPVLVTANYKMSFDRLREALVGRNSWILVLDTKGINVWCAAGKGTFGTTELTERIFSSRLADLVSHRQLILPQLAGPGVSAHQVKKISGFKVIYGPIRAEDLPVFLDAGMNVTPSMRLKSFSIWERVELIPVELVGALKTFALIAPLMLFLCGLTGPAGFFQNLADSGLFALLGVLAGIFAGAILSPTLLPWLPGRAFSVKGLWVGITIAFLYAVWRGLDLRSTSSELELLSWLLMIPAISAYLAMNFTGASTYTSLSGVKKEMRWALPLQIIAGVAGLGFWIVSMLSA